MPKGTLKACGLNNFVCIKQLHMNLNDINFINALETILQFLDML